MGLLDWLKSSKSKKSLPVVDVSSAKKTKVEVLKHQDKREKSEWNLPNDKGVNDNLPEDHATTDDLASLISLIEDYEGGYVTAKQACAFQKTVTLSDKEFKAKYPNLFEFRNSYFSSLFFFIMKDLENSVAKIDVHDPYSLPNWLTLEGLLKMAIVASTDIGKERYKRSEEEEEESDNLFRYVDQEHLEKLEMMKKQLFKTVALIRAGKSNEKGVPKIYGGAGFMHLFCELDDDQFNWLHPDLSAYRKTIYEIFGELILNTFDRRSNVNNASVKSTVSTESTRVDDDKDATNATNSIYSDIGTNTEIQENVTFEVNVDATDTSSSIYSDIGANIESQDTLEEAEDRTFRFWLPDLIYFLELEDDIFIIDYPFLKEVRQRFFRYACGVIIEADLAYELRLKHTGIIPS